MPSNTETATVSPTLTPTSSPSYTLAAPSASPTITPFERAEAAVVSTTFIMVVSPTTPSSPTTVPAPSATLAMSDTATPADALVARAIDLTPVTDAAQTQGFVADGEPGAERFPVELIAGIGLIVAFGLYAALYWRGAQAADRYQNGFFIKTCPVCRRGHLVMETKRARMLGIPRLRHLIHCTHCRSVLREAGERRWRYAVDPVDNPSMYAQLNGQVLDEGALIMMAARALDTTIAEPTLRSPGSPPEFVGDED